MKASIQDIYKTDPLKACRMALRRTVSIPEQNRLEAIDGLLGTCGTEAIRGQWQNGYWCDIVAAYCNIGDTYALTVLQVRGDFSGCASRFLVTSYGDWVEKNSEKYGIQ